MVSLLVSSYFSIVSFTDCTQIVTLFDVESPTSWSAYFFLAIHEIIVELIDEFGCQRIWLPI